MNGVAAGSWSDGVYVIVRTEDWAEAIMSVVIHDLGKDGATKEQLLVTIWGFLCLLMIATSCAASWSNRVVLRHRQLSRAAVGHNFASSTRLWQLHLWPAVVADGAVQI